MSDGKIIPSDRISAVFGPSESDEKEPVKESTIEINSELLSEAVETGIELPSVSLYSPMVASMLQYFKLTIPGFCKSDTGTKHLERTFKKKYPDLWEATERELRNADVRKRRKATILRR